MVLSYNSNFLGTFFWKSPLKKRKVWPKFFLWKEVKIKVVEGRRILMCVFYLEELRVYEVFVEKFFVLFSMAPQGGKWGDLKFKFWIVNDESRRFFDTFCFRKVSLLSLSQFPFLLINILEEGRKYFWESIFEKIFLRK